MGGAGLKGGTPEIEGTAAPTNGRIRGCTVILALGAASDVFSANLMISLRETPLEEGCKGWNLNKGEKYRIILEDIVKSLSFMDFHPIPGRMY
jgi:hypothetical protein